jgi:nucleotide-binding universal stress UspA family protein
MNLDLSPLAVGWDDSAGARHAASWAAAVAGALGGAPLHLVCALTLPPVPSHSWEISVAELLGRHEAAARARLEKERAELLAFTPRVEIFLRRWTPVETLLEYAEKHECAALVVGRSSELAPHVLLGSISSAVARLADRPVIVVRGEEHVAPPRRILLAVDGSAPSRHAASAVARLFPSAKVTTVFVGEKDKPALAESGLRDLLDQAGLDSSRATPLLESGSPAERLLDLARVGADGGFDLVAAGRTGHSAWRHLLLGGVAEKLLQLAPCPVLLAH